MKMTYTEIITHKKAFRRKTRCPMCFSKHYEIVEEIDRNKPSMWYVRCPVCGYCSHESNLRAVAIARWKQHEN